MFGLSYFGFTQMAAAEGNPPHLKTICPFQNDALNPFSITKANTYGCFHLMWLYGRVLDSLNRAQLSEADKQRIRATIADYSARWNELMMVLPARDTQAARIEGVPLLHDYVNLVDGVEDDAYLRSSHRPIRLKGIDLPMLHLTGWFDIAKDGTLDNYREIATNGTACAKAQSRLIIGPWVHGGGLSARVDGEDFGSENSGEGRDIRGLMHRWFDRWLKGEDNGVDRETPVLLYVLGANRWREETEWPPHRALPQAWYLHGSGETRRGALNGQTPADEPPQRYDYDPANPFPSDYTDTQGRTLLADPTALEARPDLLSYLSEPLQADLEVTGMVSLCLYAATSAVDTDFFARLSDVDEHGRAFPLVSGIVRGRFRHGRTPEPLEPDKPYAFNIELGGIANLFRAGHRIRLEITSSFYPANDRNLNTGERVGWGTKTVVASQTIFHNREYPTHLVLPVISD
jgi:putative CocE/NonD family hydrolase